MNDHKEPIERELEEALAVDPSPDLQARIRRCVAGIPGRPKRPLWLAPAVGLAAAAAMVLAVVTLRTDEAPRSAVVVPKSVVGPAVPSSPTETGLPIEALGQSPEVARAHTAQQTEAAALLQKAAAMPGMTVSTPTNTAIPSVEPLELAPLHRPELEIDPVPALSLSPMAQLDTFSIEPFNLKAQEPGVNE